MKRYNINPIKRQFNWGEMDVISLGEEGRGRKSTLIPYHAKEDAEYLEIGFSKNGNSKIINSTAKENWLASLNGCGTYTRGTYGTVYVPKEYLSNIKVIAYGYGAYGDAGRIGTWMDYLVEVKEGTLLKVRPSGGSHKRERYWLYFGDKEVSRIEKNEMDMFCESFGLDKPEEEFNKLIDLSDLKGEFICIY